MASLEDRALGAYLGLAVGDALGATVEFMTPREINAQFGVHDKIIGGGWLNLVKGQVTDDTQMSLALGKSIMKTGQVEAEAAAKAFDAWMRTKPVDIGNTVRRGLVTFRRTGNPVMEENEYAAGNGACMRCLPVALATLGADPKDILIASRDQAHVTHNNAHSDAATECVINMVQAALQGGDIKSVLSYSRLLGWQFAEFQWGKRRENPSGHIIETLQAVFQALEDTEDFESAVVNVVNRGGDADTTGAITGMVAGALYGREAIPRAWLRDLDKPTRRLCESQARGLLALSPLRRNG